MTTKRDDLYLDQILVRIQDLKEHLRGVTRERFYGSKMIKSAVVRELEVIGEASKKVSPETQQRFPHIPWSQLVGMRNRLIHGYFDVDYSIVWEVVKHDLNELEDFVRNAFFEIAPPAHPWRTCPLGYYNVRSHRRTIKFGSTSVREHCRRNPSGKDQLYPKEIHFITETQLPNFKKLGAIGKLPVQSNNQFDAEILIWTKYWNDVFAPSVPLEPNIIKALMGSESSFRTDIRDVKLSKRNFARGIMQITDQTREILGSETSEIGEHFLTLNKDDAKDPIVAIAASIRWLFHKKQLATSLLKRPATWEEAVANYKSYLRSKKPFQSQRGMIRFTQIYNELEASLEK